MSRPPYFDVMVHESVHPDALAAELRDGLVAGSVATRQHYVTPRQARRWREIAAAFSPARNESDGVPVYDAINGLIADRVGAEGAHVIGLGCGDGAKERRLLDSLAGRGPLTATAVDVSLPLVQVAVDRLSAAAGTALGRPVVCDLGLAAADLPAMVGDAPGARIVTLYGILPGMAAFEAMAAALALLRPGDMLALSANLLPEGEGAMERIVAQYDNAPTRRWLEVLLEDSGLERGEFDIRIGPLGDPGTGATAAVGAWLEPVHEIDLKLEAGEVRLEPGSRVQLLRSARHTPEGLAALVEAAGLELLALEVSPTGEEGVALAVAPG